MAVDPILLVGAGILGLCVGSFLNVCILRLAKEDRKQRSLFHPPSTCPRCGRRIAWRDNVPVVSWLVLRGRCRWCGQPISIQYPIIEAVVALLWIAAMVGAFVGWKLVLPTVFAGALFGTLVYVPLLLLRKRKQHVPFGVFLAMGAAVVFVFGDAILDWYKRFFWAG